MKISQNNNVSLIPDKPFDTKYINKAIFFDRDGILNKLVFGRPPWEISEIEIFNESWKLLEIAKEFSYIPVIITNQPDAARGSVDLDNLNKINSFICNKLDIKFSYICNHGEDGICHCRKPSPGMIFKASKDLKINLSKSFLIGDREKDIQAGFYAGCRTIYKSKSRIKLADYCVPDHQSLTKLLIKLLSK